MRMWEPSTIYSQLNVFHGFDQETGHLNLTILSRKLLFVPHIEGFHRLFSSTFFWDEHLRPPGPCRFQSSRFWSNLFFSKENRVWLYDPQVSATWVERNLWSKLQIHPYSALVCTVSSFEQKWNLSVTLRLWENLSPRKFGQVSKLNIADRPCLPALPAHLVPWYFQDSTCALFTLTFFSVIPSEKSMSFQQLPCTLQWNLEWVKAT